MENLPAPILDLEKYNMIKVIQEEFNPPLEEDEVEEKVVSHINEIGIGYEGYENYANFKRSLISIMLHKGKDTDYENILQFITDLLQSIESLNIEIEELKQKTFDLKNGQITHLADLSNRMNNDVRNINTKFNNLYYTLKNKNVLKENDYV